MANKRKNTLLSNKSEGVDEKKKRKRKRTLVSCIYCGSAARIESSKTLDIKVTEKYCACSNVENCGATFVMTLSFSRNLNPPVKTTRQIAMELLLSIPESERLSLQLDLFPPSK